MSGALRRPSDAALARRMRAGDASAREAMARRYLPLARSLAWRYAHTAEPLDDLIQVASVGLLKALDHWDPERGFAFSTYAVPTILGELRRYFRASSWLVRPPRSVQERVLAVERARGVDGESVPERLAKRLQCSPEEVREAMLAGEGRWARAVEDDTPGDADEAPRRRMRADATDDVGYAAAEARATVERLARVLDAQTREVLRLRYQEDLLQREIAKRIGCSQMHVSRLLRRGLERLEIAAAI